MSRLAELIAELCPDGVEFKSLGEISDIISGYPFDSSKFSDSGIRLMRGMNVKRGEFDFSQPLNKYWKDDIGLEKFRLKENDIVIAMDGALVGRSYGYVYKKHLPVLLVQRVARIRTEKQNSRYIYHYLTCGAFAKMVDKKKTEGAIPHISLKDIASFKIPVPPMEVQREIVRILDKFSEKSTELCELLSAELVARKKQYEYYREKLLTFSEDVPRIPLGEIGTFTRGNGLQKKDFTDSGVPCIHYGQIHTYYRNSTDKTKSFVSPECAKSLRKAKKGDLIIVTTSENIEAVCKCLVWLGEDEVCVGGEMSIFSHSQNPKYIAYCLQIANFFDFKKKNSTGTKVIRVHQDKLKNFKIPLPSLPEQRRIADILDRFESRYNDLSVSIPAEIAARKKQYEYYRDRLLTFREKRGE